MKKISSFMLAFVIISFVIISFVIIFGLSTPAAGSPGFFEGYVSEISEGEYNSINIKEYSGNDNSIEVKGVGVFYFDNAYLNTWYLDVTEDIEGIIDIAYRIGLKYYNVRYTLNGPGMYRVGDSGTVKAVKIGTLEKKTSAITYEVADGWNPSLLEYTYNHQAYAFIFFVNKLRDGVVVSTNKHVEHFRVPHGFVIIEYDEGYNVRFKWENHMMKSVTITEEKSREW